ncbi:MAG TPA: hypothetical protein DHW49_07725 [Anaerolineae bacterium]|nr:hypothetical protein [Anaerolineae bacterium]
MLFVKVWFRYASFTRYSTTGLV